jgi:dTDP-4-dehydrorhamnose reductase
MTWLVVGGNGQLGKALSVVLGGHGVDFRAWGSADLDIRSSSRTRELIGALKPSVVINAAAWTDVDGAESDPEGAHAVNTEGALNLAVAAKTVSAVFAHVSTDYVFSGVGSVPWQESDLRAPVSVYGTTKTAGEVAVLAEYPERTYVFRTAWLYSEWGKNFAKTMVRLALSGDNEVKVVDDQIGQPTSALDLAEQIVSAIEAEIPFGIYHGTNSGQASWFEFAQEIFSLCGDGVVVEQIVRIDSSSFVRPAKRPAYSVLGHDSWSAVGSSGVSIAPMRDWKIALREIMPMILRSVEYEREGTQE